jgi:hypothetical protein
MVTKFICSRHMDRGSLGLMKNIRVFVLKDVTIM